MNTVNDSSSSARETTWSQFDAEVSEAMRVRLRNARWRTSDWVTDQHHGPADAFNQPPPLDGSVSTISGLQNEVEGEAAASGHEDAVNGRRSTEARPTRFPIFVRKSAQTSEQRHKHELQSLARPLIPTPTDSQPEETNGPVARRARLPNWIFYRNKPMAVREPNAEPRRGDVLLTTSSADSNSLLNRYDPDTRADLRNTPDTAGRATVPSDPSNAITTGSSDLYESSLREAVGQPPQNALPAAVEEPVGDLNRNARDPQAIERANLSASTALGGSALQKSNSPHDSVEDAIAITDGSSDLADDEASSGETRRSSLDTARGITAEQPRLRRSILQLGEGYTTFHNNSNIEVQRNVAQSQADSSQETLHLNDQSDRPVSELSFERGSEPPLSVAGRPVQETE